MINNLSLYNLIKENNLQNIRQFLILNDIDTIDDEFCSLLHYAVIEQKEEIIDFLLENSANINILNNKGLTPIQYAAMYENLEILKKLVRTNEYKSLNLIHLAAATGKKNNISYLINIGFPVNTLDYNKRTPLHWAAQEGNFSIIELLYQNGAILDVIDDEGQSPLDIASSENYYHIVKFLIHQNVNLELNTGTSPLMIACAYNNYDIVNELLDAGANINCRDEEGRTSLFYAKLRKDEEMVNLLINNGASLNIVDNYGISISNLDNLEIRSKLYQELYE